MEDEPVHRGVASLCRGVTMWFLVEEEDIIIPVMVHMLSDGSIICLVELAIQQEP